MVKIKALPQPDFLDLSLDDAYVCLLTDDGSPTTVKLAQSLTERNWKVVVLRFQTSTSRECLALPPEVDCITLEKLTEEHLKEKLEIISSHYNSVRGFIHLNSSNQSNQDDRVCDFDLGKAIVKQVFLLAKHLKKPLNEEVLGRHSFFFTVVRLDGKFGLGQKSKFIASHGGLFGLVKTLKLEWESVFCRAIDLSSELDAEQSVQRIIAEIYDPNRQLVEVGYTPEQRTTIVCEEASIGNKKDNISQCIYPSSVFLVSGGAKGITAECVIALARRYQCKFILLGRSSIGTPEPEWAKNCFDEKELKKKIMENLFAQGEMPKPLKIQAEFNSIISKRKIEKTLQAIEQEGGKAEYLNVDVTNPYKLQEMIAPVIERMGNVTGIIHGAGNLADKLIERKSEQDFETVYAAKVEGLDNLLRCVPVSQLNHLILFSSVAAFYGNIGQSDYAIANEILNKTAHLVKQRYPSCHVVSINWGPWEIGMVTPKMKEIFEQKDIKLISSEIGTKIFVDELSKANPEDVQIVIGSPLINSSKGIYPKTKKFTIRRLLTWKNNPFLDSHVIGDRAVLPFVCAESWIASTCEQLYPGYKFFSCTNARVLKGIVFNGDQEIECFLDLEEITRTDSIEIKLQAKIWSKDRRGKIFYHYTCQVDILTQLPDCPTYNSFNILSDKAISGQQLYQNKTLFHGPCFQGVEHILNISSERLTMRCILPRFPEEQQGQFTTQTLNPYIIDVQLHSILVWVQHFYQKGCLPSRMQKIEQFIAIPFDQLFYVSMEIKSKKDLTVVADVIAHSSQGQIYTRILGMEATISNRLNDLFTNSHKN